MYIHDVEFDGTLLGFQVKTKPGRGGVVENVWIEDVVTRNLHHPVFFLNTTYGADTFTPSVQALPKLRNIFARQIRLENLHVTVQNGPAISMKNCQHAIIANSAADKPCEVFLGIEGEKSGNIHL